MDAKRATASGAIATGVTTALWLIEPSVGLPKIAVGQLLSTAMSVSVAHWNASPAAGWLVHFAVGILLAWIYAAVFLRRLSGSPVLRGAVYGLLVFVLAQVLFMPFVGAGFFSRGDVELLLGSLIGHLVYGMVVGWIYGLPVTPAIVIAGPSPSPASGTFER